LQKTAAQGKAIAFYHNLLIIRYEIAILSRFTRLAEGFGQTSSRFPQHELYGLTSQIRRAAVSVPSNIAEAEGAGRVTEGEFVQAVGNARGSLFEIETQVHIAERWRFINSEESARLFERTREVGRLTGGLIRALSSKRLS